MNKERREELRKLANASTKVVAWYPHKYGGKGHFGGNATVRGPFGRWFECYGGDNGMGDPVKYPVPVADIGDDVEFAAAAMNSLVPLLDEIDRLETALADANGAIVRNSGMPGPNDPYWDDRD